MVRILLLLLLAYFIWRILRNAFAAIMSSKGRGGYVRGKGDAQPKQEYKNVKDAEFEDLPGKKEDGTS